MYKNNELYIQNNRISSNILIEIKFKGIHTNIYQTCYEIDSISYLKIVV